MKLLANTTVQEKVCGTFKAPKSGRSNGTLVLAVLTDPFIALKIWKKSDEGQ